VLLATAAPAGGCTFEFFRSKTAEDPGTAVASGALHTGRNGRRLARARGDFFWLDLTDTSTTTRPAFEEGFLTVAPAGRSRP